MPAVLTILQYKQISCVFVVYAATICWKSFKWSLLSKFFAMAFPRELEMGHKRAKTAPKCWFLASPATCFFYFQTQLTFTLLFCMPINTKSWVLIALVPNLHMSTYFFQEFLKDFVALVCGVCCIQHLLIVYLSLVVKQYDIT